MWHPISRIATSLSVLVLAGLAGACSSYETRTSNQLTENRCASYRVAGEATPEYVLCASGARGTADEIAAAEIVAVELRNSEAVQAKARCDTYQLTRDLDGYMKCVEYTAITKEAHERLVLEAASRRSANQASVRR